MHAKRSSKKRIFIFIGSLLLLLAILSALAVWIAQSTLRAAEEYYETHYLAYDFSTDSYDYRESDQPLDNPAGGFYNLLGYLLSDELSSEDLAQRLAIDRKDCAKEPMVLIEINLMQYNDRELSAHALDLTRQILQHWNDKDYQIILRFLYDWDGNAMATEPAELALIKTHMSQLAPIVNDFSEQIYTMQGIFVGNYGEMHGSNYLESADMCELMYHLDTVIDASIFLSVRTPAQRRTILDSADAFPAQNTLAARLGLFNDGMLGSPTDLGTYGESGNTALNVPWTRSEELTYQNTLCRQVPNGGEVVIDNPFNDLPSAIEAFQAMHISYLSCMHDAEVLEKWRTSSVTDDEIWNGTDGYSYIDAHMGYRYYCNQVSGEPFDCWNMDTTNLTLALTNTGFAPCYEPLTWTVTIASDHESSIVSQMVFDEHSLQAISGGEQTTLSVPLSLRKYAEGTYRVYLSCETKSGTKLALASRLPVSEYGYETASFSVSKTPTVMPSSEELLQQYVSGSDLSLPLSWLVSLPFAK